MRMLALNRGSKSDRRKGSNLDRRKQIGGMVVKNLHHLWLRIYPPFVAPRISGVRSNYVAFRDFDSFITFAAAFRT